MAQQYSFTSPSSSEPPHGGDMDPNEVRLRQARAQQQTMATSTHPDNSMSPNESAAPYRDNMDPTAGQINMAQGSGATANHRSGVDENNIPPPQRPGYNPHQTQPPQSVSSVYHHPDQSGQGFFSNTQSHPVSQNHTSGFTPQGNPSYPMSNPQSPKAFGGYGAGTQPYTPSPVGYPPLAKKKSSMNKEYSAESGILTPRSYYQGKAEKGYFNIFHNRSEWRVKWPNTFQMPGLALPGSDKRHRDIMQRAKIFPTNDYYLSPADGHLGKLFVQSTQAIFDADPNSTWRRTFIRNQSPFILQVANWVLNSLPIDDREATNSDIAKMGAKWIPACALILLFMVFPVDASGQVRNGGNYDVFLYKHWGYPIYTRNPKEDREVSTLQRGSSYQPSASSQLRCGELSKRSLNPISERPIEPTYLCFRTGTEGMERCEVSQWKKDHNQTATYVFVSYTSEEFETEEKQLFLHEVGEHAARAAGVSAYWVGCSCLGRDELEVEQNVWRISDIIRGAHKMVIAVSNQADETNTNADTQVLLRQWGTRVWTLPEILLSPSNTDILVYARNADIRQPRRINKRRFATMWEDAPLSRELIDHYEGNLILSPLELVTIALCCLYNRQRGFYLPGDMAYALMGLVRRRPTVVKADTDFQAFARLSLANVNDLLLERLICILPKTTNQPWYELDDQWECSLWDIYPTTQICGIGDNNTVILDGAFAAAIRWKAFAHVATLTRDSWRRFFLRYAFRSASYLFIIGISLLSNGLAVQSIDKDNGLSSAVASPYIGVGAFFLTVSLCFILLSPYFIRILYTGKLWATQPWFFGFEGYLDISTIERHIFGVDMGHLKWSTNGSPLSVHSPNEYGECIGEDPTTVKATADLVENAINARMGERRIFTLVDTYTLTVTIFEAVRPPVAVVLCGEEGGMQRALLCSYESSNQTLYKESVLRMETPVQEKMSRVGRLKLGLKREMN